MQLSCLIELVNNSNCGHKVILQLICCQSAMSDFQTILGTLGGPGERERGQQLIARIQVSGIISIIAKIVNIFREYGIFFLQVFNLVC